MRLSDDYEEEWNRGLPLIYMALGVSICFIAILIIVFMVNKKPSKDPIESIEMFATETVEVIDNRSPGEKSVEEMISGSKLTSEDLEIWDDEPMFEEETETEVFEKEEIVTTEGVRDKNLKIEDPSQGGTLTKILSDSGEEDWIPIVPSLDKHSYNFAGLDFQDPILNYVEENEKISYMGVDVSKYQGFVDYNKLKKAGVSFVMVRVGARGYGSGKLIMDEYFADNMKGATDAGLSVGAYFFSQAITVEEAQQEVDLIVEQLEGYPVTYPVAFDMEAIQGDDARIDDLSKDEKTQIASVFLKGIKEAGYTPIIYGKKEWLLTKIDLEKLEEYDIWLADESTIPDYPYQFEMWQYTTKGKIDGIAGNADLNISFIDYDLK